MRAAIALKERDVQQVYTIARLLLNDPDGLVATNHVLGPIYCFVQRVYPHLYSDDRMALLVCSFWCAIRGQIEAANFFRNT